jgi:predicted branched-subunit amino acid permease
MFDHRSAGTSWVDRGALADAIPLFVPVVPFGFVVGVAVMESAMPAAAGWSTSATIFAGASQLATVTLAGVATLWAVVVAALVINSRHVMYSAALASTFGSQPRWFRWAAPFVLIDQVYALVATRTDQPPDQFRRYYLTVGVFFYLSWIAAVSVGMVAGPWVPAAWRLDIAPAIMFTGLVVLASTRAPAITAAATAAMVGWMSSGLPDRLGILVGAMAGVLVGAIVETRQADSAEAVEGTR